MYPSFTRTGNSKRLLHLLVELVHDLGREGLQVVTRRARLGDEDGAPVVVQLTNRLEDVGEGAVPAVLRRGVEVRAGVPALRELLDGGDVDVAIVQVRVEAGHVLREEGAVG